MRELFVASHIEAHRHDMTRASIKTHFALPPIMHLERAQRTKERVLTPPSTNKLKIAAEDKPCSHQAERAEGVCPCACACVLFFRTRRGFRCLTLEECANGVSRDARCFEKALDQCCAPPHPRQRVCVALSSLQGHETDDGDSDRGCDQCLAVCGGCMRLLKTKEGQGQLVTKSQAWEEMVKASSRPALLLMQLHYEMQNRPTSRRRFCRPVILELPTLMHPQIRDMTRLRSLS